MAGIRHETLKERERHDGTPQTKGQLKQYAEFYFPF